jgi:hypothetical protein
MQTVQSVASEANTFLYRDTQQGKVLPQKEAPQWFMDLCHHAHGDMLPDDWRYEFIQDALNALENDGDDESGPRLDDLYPYTADRLNWLVSRLDRHGYCDEAAADMGESPKQILDFVALGMDRELREVSDLVRERLEEIADDQLDKEAAAE